MKANQRHFVQAASRINAPPKTVYAIIADYRDGHPHILPDTFRGLTVERGGIGQGTVIQFKMRIFGRTQSFRAAITEPEPGRILVETDLGADGAITTFTVNPGPAEGQCEVSIRTELPVRSGLLGALQRFLITRSLQPLYARQLGLLAAYVENIDSRKRYPK